MSLDTATARRRASLMAILEEGPECHYDGEMEMAAEIWNIDRGLGRAEIWWRVEAAVQAEVDAIDAAASKSMSLGAWLIVNLYCTPNYDAARAAVREGRVTINGQAVESLLALVREDDEVTVRTYRGYLASKRVYFA